MSALPRALAVAACLATVAGCSHESAPTAPREAQIAVEAIEGTAFNVIEIRAANATHYPCPPDGESAFAAPYTFFLENAGPPIQGTVEPADPTQPLDLVQLVLGGESVPRQIEDPNADTPITSNPAGPTPPGSPTVPCQGVVRQGKHEVRFDVVAQPRDAFYGATIGHQQGSHIISVANAPTTIFLEDAVERVSGVFGKRDASATLTARLYVDGALVDSATIASGSSDDAVVKFQF